VVHVALLLSCSDSNEDKAGYISIKYQIIRSAAMLTEQPILREMAKSIKLWRSNLLIYQHIIVIIATKNVVI